MLLLLAGLLLLPLAATAQYVTGFGTLAATNASASISTMTLGPNSAAWPPPQPTNVYVSNATTSAGLLYVCPLGGTCTVANGIPIAPGASYGFARPAGAMTVIAATTATVWTQW
jgi:hypothetical protein